MAKIIFRFDTEDYINKNAADGILNAATMLKDAGLKGSFAVVGELAKALKKWGREDIIEALKYHEIGSHSLMHSHHPNINEYTDLEDFDGALEEFYLREKECVKILKEVFQIEDMNFWCGPGASISYVAQYGYYYMGLKISHGAGGYFGDRNCGRIAKYANTLITKTTSYLIDEFGTATKAEIDELLENIAKTQDVAILCHHPAMSIVDTFFDELNFFGENIPEDRWIPSPVRSEEEQNRWKENFAYLLEKIKADDRLEVVTNDYIVENFFNYERKITAETLKEIAPQLCEEWFPVTLPDSYCLSDIMLACRDLLMGKEEHICGEVYGFLYEPFAIEKAVKLSADDIKVSAGEIGDRFLPERINVGGIEIGPADWVRAAIAVITEGVDEVLVKPGPWQLDLNHFPEMNGRTLKGNWVHFPEFEDNFISNRIRYQLWTLMLPKGTRRLIF